MYTPCASDLAKLERPLPYPRRRDSSESQDKSVKRKSHFSLFGKRIRLPFCAQEACLMAKQPASFSYSAITFLVDRVQSVTLGDATVTAEDAGLLEPPNWLNDQLLSLWCEHVRKSTPDARVLILPPNLAYFIKQCNGTRSLRSSFHCLAHD